MAQGFLHPNCRHGLTTYYPELENIENETEEEYKSDIDYINERLNYITRNIKVYDRLSSGSIASENVNIYKSKKKQWENELNKIPTDDELYAINTYVGSESYKINEALRNGTDLDERLTKVVKNLDTVLDKIPNYEGIVTRSVSIYSEDIEHFLKSYPEGEIMSHNEFLSTTVGDTYNPEARVQIKIISKTGKDMRKYNELEQEILFKRNVKFLVQKIDTTDDYYVKIYLEEVI